MFILKSSSTDHLLGCLQLQQRKVCVDVVRSLCALLHDIFLEDGGRLGIVAVEAVENLVDVIWPLGRVVEWHPHGERQESGQTLVDAKLRQLMCACANINHVTSLPAITWTRVRTSIFAFSGRVFKQHRLSMSLSDSDSPEGADYTETNVLLGYASKEPTGDSISHLGGLPVCFVPLPFLSNVELTRREQTWLDEHTAPPGALATCGVCKGLLSLLVQLNGDLPQNFPGHERRLYVLGCRRKACRRKDGCIRGFRGVRMLKGFQEKAEDAAPDKSPAHPALQTPPAQPMLGEQLFGAKAPSNTKSGSLNPFSNSSTGNASANPFASTSSTSNANPVPTPVPKSLVSSKDSDMSTLPETFASKARISGAASPTPSAHQPWPAKSAFLPPYPYYYLDAEYETLDSPSKPSVPANARLDVEESGSSSADAREDKDAFESTLDRTFQKFADRIGQNPEQVLRYEFGGQPLLYSKADTVGKLFSPDASASKVSSTTRAPGMPRCRNCGAERTFEAQLAPHAITELEAEDISVDGLDWGAVLLGVCSKDCVPVGVKEGETAYVEEWVGVQWEEVPGKA